MYIKFLNQNSPQIGIKCIFATATIDLCQRLGHLVVFFDIVIELTPPPPFPMDNDRCQDVSPIFCI